MVGDRHEGGELAQVHERQYRGQSRLAGKTGGRGSGGGLRLSVALGGYFQP
jgi:hypothetical protein